MKNYQKKKRKILIFLIIFHIILAFSYLCSFITYLFLKYNGENTNIFFEQNREIQVINSTTSIVFYTIAGHNQSIFPDLRGRFWEFQLKFFKGDFKLEYFSDRELTVNDIQFKPIINKQQQSTDQNLCIRTAQTWSHFIENHPKMKWYFRGTHDTFINLTALNEVINDLEKKYDPMKENVFAYNVHEYSKVLYPQGGTGWLFSNYAVKQFNKSNKLFQSLCADSFDDVSLALVMRSLNIDVLKWASDRFICTFPNKELNIVKYKRWMEVPKCPKNGYRLHKDLPYLPVTRVRGAASIHMHKVPMNEAWDLLLATPQNIAVTFPNPNTPTFCKI